jgi:hypothetical protein
MRAREILDEDYNQSLESDLNNLLIGVKGNGATRIPTQKLVDKMQQSGYSVSADSLMLLLQDNPVVTNVTQDFVELAAPESATGQASQTQDSASQVSDMAQSATKI